MVYWTKLKQILHFVQLSIGFDTPYCKWLEVSFWRRVRSLRQRIWRCHFSKVHKITCAHAHMAICIVYLDIFGYPYIRKWYRLLRSRCKCLVYPPLSLPAWKKVINLCSRLVEIVQSFDELNMTGVYTIIMS